MRILNVPTRSRRLAERAAIEYVRRKERLLARVIYSRVCAETGQTQVILEPLKNR